MPSLLIGCGNSRIKKVHFEGNSEWAGKLVTADMNPNCDPDYLLDLDISWWKKSLPWNDDTFDEIGAYDCLEHWGKQGDWRGWFDEMAEYHRILKPGGTMGILVPVGGDALADPGHVRFFHANWFYMLAQDFYAKAIAMDMPVTDYRWYWKKNFEILALENHDNHHISVILKKPDADKA